MGNYSVEGNYRVGNKIVFEERIYHEASTFKEAVKMAKEDGNVGSGMAFFNSDISEKCNLGELNLGRLFLMTMSKN